MKKRLLLGIIPVVLLSSGWHRPLKYTNNPNSVDECTQAVMELYFYPDVKKKVDLTYGITHGVNTDLLLLTNVNDKSAEVKVILMRGNRGVGSYSVKKQATTHKIVLKVGQLLHKAKVKDRMLVEMGNDMLIVPIR